MTDERPDEGWEWLGMVDPVKVERERFNIPNVGVLRNREGIHLGDLSIRPQGTREVAIIRALTRERERENRERHRVEVRGAMHGRIRTLENTLARERREHAKTAAWRQKLSDMGRLHSGPSSLEAP